MRDTSHVHRLFSSGLVPFNASNGDFPSRFVTHTFSVSTKWSNASPYIHGGSCVACSQARTRGITLLFARSTTAFSCIPIRRLRLDALIGAEGLHVLVYGLTTLFRVQIFDKMTVLLELILEPSDQVHQVLVCLTLARLPKDPLKPCGFIDDEQ